MELNLAFLKAFHWGIVFEGPLNLTCKVLCDTSTPPSPTSNEFLPHLSTPPKTASHLLSFVLAIFHFT